VSLPSGKRGDLPRNNGHHVTVHPAPQQRNKLDQSCRNARDQGRRMLDRTRMQRDRTGDVGGWAFLCRPSSSTKVTLTSQALKFLRPAKKPFDPSTHQCPARWLLHCVSCLPPTQQTQTLWCAFLTSSPTVPVHRDLHPCWKNADLIDQDSIHEAEWLGINHLRIFSSLHLVPDRTPQPLLLRKKSGCFFRPEPLPSLNVGSITLSRRPIYENGGMVADWQANTCV